MPKSRDFTKIHRNFVKQYGQEKGDKLFYQWCNKHGLDWHRPYGGRNKQELDYPEPPIDMPDPIPDFPLPIDESKFEDDTEEQVTQHAPITDDDQLADITDEIANISECPYGDFQTYNPSALSQHINLYHTELSPTSADYTPAPNPADLDIWNYATGYEEKEEQYSNSVCPVCHIQILYTELAGHVRKEHPQYKKEEKGDPEGWGTYWTCHICGGDFKGDIPFDEHLKESHNTTLDKVRRLEETKLCLACKNDDHEDCWSGGEFFRTDFTRHSNCDCQVCYPPKKEDDLEKRRYRVEPLPTQRRGTGSEITRKDTKHHHTEIMDPNRPPDDKWIYMVCVECNMPIQIEKRRKKEEASYVNCPWSDGQYDGEQLETHIDAAHGREALETWRNSGELGTSSPKHEGKMLIRENSINKEPSMESKESNVSAEIIEIINGIEGQLEKLETHVAHGDFEKGGKLYQHLATDLQELSSLLGITHKEKLGAMFKAKDGETVAPIGGALINPSYPEGSPVSKYPLGVKDYNPVPPDYLNQKDFKTFSVQINWFNNALEKVDEIRVALEAYMLEHRFNEKNSYEEWKGQPIGDKRGYKKGSNKA